jgi:hypothetical protein
VITSNIAALGRHFCIFTPIVFPRLHALQAADVVAQQHPTRSRLFSVTDDDRLLLVEFVVAPESSKLFVSTLDAPTDIQEVEITLTSETGEEFHQLLPLAEGHGHWHLPQTVRLEGTWSVGAIVPVAPQTDSRIGDSDAP